MPEDKKIRVAVWEYRNAKGKRRIAYFGDVVALPAAEVERGERQGVFDQPEPVVEVVEPDADLEPDDLQLDAAADAAAAAAGDLSSGPKGPVPPRAGAKELWVDYAVENGLSREAAEKLNRAQLIEKFGGKE